MIPPMNAPSVVIIGAGFGGLYAAKQFCNQPVRVTILDRSNYHLFQPLLYQVATAGLSPGNIAQPIRDIVRKCKNIQTILAEVSAIDVNAKKVRVEDGEYSYDYLIVATGATHQYFGHSEWEPIALGLKTLEDAVTIRRRFLTAFEEAEKETDPSRRQAWITFVIVGGGPTGVELAGTMSEMAKRTFAEDFRHVDPRKSRIILLEGGPRVLNTYTEKLSEGARRQLEKLGVEVRTNALVTNVDSDGVYIGKEKIETFNIFWAAGVAASPLGKSLGAPLDRAGRVQVQPDLTIAGHPEVFIIGDLVTLKDPKGQTVPGVAPAAMQMGRYAAKKILNRIKKKSETGPFVYNDKGSLATIGRAAAVAMFGKVQISGLLAWLSWLLIHIYFLIGFRNRLIVLIQWAWAYLGMQTNARLITFYQRETHSKTPTRQ